MVIHGAETDLISLVESRTRPRTEPPVWREYWNPARDSMQRVPVDATMEERFKLIMSGARGIAEVKNDLITELCTGDWLYLDYWGCTAEVFGGVDPPGATRWEDFISPMLPHAKPEPPVPLDCDGSVGVETSGRYLPTSANTTSMIVSLRHHVQDLQAMGEVEVAKLERWQNFCAAHPEFCVVYQIDF